MVLDLAHYDPETKYKNASGRTVSPGCLSTVSTLTKEIPFFRPLCADCHRLETRRYQLQHLSTKKDAVRHQKRRALRNRIVLLEKLLRRKCIDCPENTTLLVTKDNSAVFEFDHKPIQDDGTRTIKVATISEMVENTRYSENVLIEEMSKCDLRCVNHHRIMTDKRGAFRKTCLANDNANYF